MWRKVASGLTIPAFNYVDLHPINGGTLLTAMWQILWGYIYILVPKQPIKNKRNYFFLFLPGPGFEPRDPQSWIHCLAIWTICFLIKIVICILIFFRFVQVSQLRSQSITSCLFFWGSSLHSQSLVFLSVDLFWVTTSVNFLKLPLIYCTWWPNFCWWRSWAPKYISVA